jgi:hypothetical protein
MDDAVRLATDCQISQMFYCFANSLNVSGQHFLRKIKSASQMPEKAASLERQRSA